MLWTMLTARPSGVPDLGLSAAATGLYTSSPRCIVYEAPEMCCADDAGCYIRMQT